MMMKINNDNNNDDDNDDDDNDDDDNDDGDDEGWECCKTHLLHRALVPICAAITRAHLHNIDEDGDADDDNGDDNGKDDPDDDRMMMQMIMTGVTISRQDPGATQAQEASRCASTLKF